MKLLVAVARHNFRCGKTIIRYLALTLMTHGDDKLCTRALSIGIATIPFINALTTVQNYLQGVWGVDSIDME